ncbi:hypothetical protein H5U35_10370 [Candidatus Aerophobetes bacterium]|nr:hypothetical protein [Candidatus Aerophobetes bacterium]
MAKPLIKETKKEFGIKAKSLIGGGAYGSGKMRKEMNDKRIKLINKASVPKDTEKLSKDEFDIDLEKEKVACREEKTTTRCHKNKTSKGEGIKMFVSPRMFVISV